MATYRSLEGITNLLAGLAGPEVKVARLTAPAAPPVTPSAVIDGTPGDDTLTGTGGADTLSGLGGNDSLTGLGGNDRLFGGASNDRLDGGAGADTLVGGNGNDTYVIDASDTITEQAGEGTDTVQSATSVTLGANIENLVLTGSGAANGTGNTAANTLTGNSGNNTLDGGAGSDKLAGGTGDDTYIIADGDTIVENAGQGTDTVRASINYTLKANLEKLILTGSAAINGTGNGGDNHLTGNGAKNILDGAGGDDMIDGGGGPDIMIGGGGSDTYVTDGGDTITENAGEGTDTVRSSVTYTLGSNLENLVLTGSAAISGTGNSSANSLDGNNGKNTLDGGGGADKLHGGANDDTYVTDGGDIITEAAGEGTDTVQSSVSFTLGAHLEKLVLTGSGAISGTGNAAANTLTGNVGNNTLDGGGGADKFLGGAGDDTYVTDGGDTIVENSGQGTDTVLSSATFTLTSNIEKLVLTGSGAINGNGNGVANSLVGNSGKNILDGAGGDDTITGGGGGDVLIGGTGNDTFVAAGDETIAENPGEGTDTVQSSASITLGANLENLVLTGSASINATGNSGANTLTGNGGNNTLDGGGGSDSMAGGAGNDTYVTDGGDMITEESGKGTDTVRSSVTYTLGTNLENLVLTGSAAINATGNTSANTLTGNSGANTLDGGGGSDKLVGGGGNDTYITDGGDTITEESGKGTDTVRSSVTYTLGTNLENLVLTGSAAINATGNSGANTLTGNSGNNSINGGAGNDTMTGGSGSDTFIFDTAIGVGNVDRITDFNVVTDTIRLENAFFIGLANGSLAASAFASNTTGNATTENHRIIYDSSTGKLFFDSDGTGAAAKVHFATIGTNLALTSADFIVF